jgi:hypothetical protein
MRHRLEKKLDVEWRMKWATLCTGAPIRNFINTVTKFQYVPQKKHRYLRPVSEIFHYF